MNRFTPKQEEIVLSRNLQKQLAGHSFEAALFALDHVRGTVCLQREEKANVLIFHPTDKDNP